MKSAYFSGYTLTTGARSLDLETRQISKMGKFIFRCKNIHVHVCCTVFVLDTLDDKMWKFSKLELQRPVRYFCMTIFVFTTNYHLSYTKTLVN